MDQIEWYYCWFVYLHLFIIEDVHVHYNVVGSIHTKEQDLDMLFLGFEVTIFADVLL